MWKIYPSNPETYAFRCDHLPDHIDETDYSFLLDGFPRNRQKKKWTIPHPWTGLFPKEQTEKEKALLKNKTILSGLAPNFKRGKAVFERNTLKIVEMDVLGNELFHLDARGEAGAVQTFRFQCTEEVFYRRVVVLGAISIIC